MVIPKKSAPTSHLKVSIYDYEGTEEDAAKCFPSRTLSLHILICHSNYNILLNYKYHYTWYTKEIRSRNY